MWNIPKWNGIETSNLHSLQHRNWVTPLVFIKWIVCMLRKVQCLKLFFLCMFKMHTQLHIIIFQNLCTQIQIQNLFLLNLVIFLTLFILLYWRYKVFINLSISDVLCTATAEVLRWSSIKWVLQIVSQLLDLHSIWRLCIKSNRTRNIPSL